MNKTDVMCEKDRAMMQEYSRRSLGRVTGHSLLFFFPTYLQGNVQKEIEKDRLIIEEAASAFAAGQAACDLDLEVVFEKTKKIDKAFLDRLMIPSFSISVRYSDIADIRIQRIWRLSKTVYSLLGNWQNTASFTDAVRTAYSEKEFKDIIVEILHLYNLETRMLGEAIHSPFRKAIRAYLETLFHAMEETMEEMATAYTIEIYGDKIVHA